MFRKEFESLSKQIINLPNKNALSEISPTIDLSILQKLKIDQQDFQVRFEKLLKNWWNSSTSIPDCEGKRFVLATLFEDLKNPLNLAIIADDLDSFKEHYKEDKSSMIFDLCCVCGSEKIVNNFFLIEGQGNRHLLESENAIAYALSSGKHDFALSLSKLAAKLGRKDPGPIALYSLSISTLFFSKTISEIFFPKANDPATSNTSVFTSHLSMTQSSKEGDIGKIKAKQLLSIPEFSEFLVNANLQEINSFFEAINEVHSNKRQKLSHPQSNYSLKEKNDNP